MASSDQLVNSIMIYIKNNIKLDEYSLKFSNERRTKEDTKKPLYLVKAGDRAYIDKDRIEVSASKSPTRKLQKLGKNILELFPIFIKLTLEREFSDFIPDTGEIEDKLIRMEYLPIYDIDGAYLKTSSYIEQVVFSKSPIEKSSDLVIDTSTRNTDSSYFRVYVQNTRLFK